MNSSVDIASDGVADEPGDCPFLKEYDRMRKHSAGRVNMPGSSAIFNGRRLDGAGPLQPRSRLAGAS